MSSLIVVVIVVVVLFFSLAFHARVLYYHHFPFLLLPPITSQVPPTPSSLPHLINLQHSLHTEASGNMVEDIYGISLCDIASILELTK